MAPLKGGDAMGVKRDTSRKLVPTTTTGSLNKYNYTVRRGSVSDLFFHLESLDTAPATKPSTKPPAEVLQVEEEDCYEVEAILESRKARKGTEYLTLTQRPTRGSRRRTSTRRSSRPSWVKPAPCSRLPAPAQFKRGAACVRAPYARRA